MRLGYARVPTVDQDLAQPERSYGGKVLEE